MSIDTTRSRILLAAGETFAEKGYEKTTIREIARRAEANLAGVNYHFGDKHRLFVEALKHAHRVRMDSKPLPAWPEDMPPEQKLREFIRTTVGWILDDSVPWHHQLMMQEMLQPTGACQEMVDDFIRPHFQLLLSILRTLTPEPLPQHRLQQLGFSVIGQCLFYRIHRAVFELLVSEEERQARFSPAQIADHISAVVLAALKRGELLTMEAEPAAFGQDDLPFNQNSQSSAGEAEAGREKPAIAADARPAGAVPAGDRTV